MVVGRGPTSSILQVYTTYMVAGREPTSPIVQVFTTYMVAGREPTSSILQVYTTYMVAGIGSLPKQNTSYAQQHNTIKYYNSHI